MRILFAGSPGIAVPSLEAIAEAGDGLELVGVLTNPDAPKGRGKRVEPSAVAEAAERLNAGRAEAGLPALPVLKPPRLGADARGAVAPLGADILAVVAYGRIFGPKFLALFPEGGVNLHPSALPKYRGATPIPAAILAGDAETAVTVQRLALEMDAGDILSQERFALAGTETTETLGAEAARRGAAILVRTLRRLASGPVRGEAQDPGAATYCSVIRKEDGVVDWSLPARDIDARMRAYYPWPLAFTFLNGARLNLLEGRLYTSGAGASDAAAPGTVLGVDKAAGILVQTGDGVIVLRRLQFETKKALDWKTFLNGARNLVGARLGAVEG